MDKYKTLKTTMGRKYRIRMSEDEIAERELFKMALIAVPFFSSILFALIFFTRG